MRSRVLALVTAAGFAVILVARAPSNLPAQTTPTASLTGQVASAQEARMEGVLVSAKKADSPLTITVVSDAQGRYRFPPGRLQPGSYSLRIRAVGYDLDGPREVEIKAGQPAIADLKLSKTRDLAAQLSNTEWLSSFPGAEPEKA